MVQEAARIQAAGLDPEQRKFALLRLLEKASMGHLADSHAAMLINVRK